MTEAITMEKVFDELKKIERRMVTKEDMEALVDTIEITSNPETMKQVMQSEEDIKRGRVKIVHSVKGMLSEI